MTPGAARDRPKEFSALILAGAVTVLVLAAAGRNPATEALVLVYLSLFVAGILRQAV